MTLGFIPVHLSAYSVPSTIPRARGEAVSKTDKTYCRMYAFTKANSLLTKLILTAEYHLKLNISKLKSIIYHCNGDSSLSLWMMLLPHISQSLILTSPAPSVDDLAFSFTKKMEAIRYKFYHLSVFLLLLDLSLYLFPSLLSSPSHKK